MQIPINLRLDDDGLLRKQCPYCDQQFKIYPSDEKSAFQRLYCPLCGLPAPKDSFFTDDQIEMAYTLASNAVFSAINKELSDLKRSFRNDKLVKLEVNPLKPKDVKPIIETSNFDNVTMSCCDKHAFIFSPSTYKVLYCHYCGEINFPA
ncbi:hypothetical protein [Heyndrickxia ginsengihumi]|uniref:hypothetical protein n=1 Tax=Heyndrickxia ginsengihumi TaxID=363870 RepID=UPI00046F9518|nr:hypothetical protein [Heyndrickxia ginsengihumi]